MPIKLETITIAGSKTKYCAPVGARALALCAQLMTLAAKDGRMELTLSDSPETLVEYSEVIYPLIADCFPAWGKQGIQCLSVDEQAAAITKIFEDYQTFVLQKVQERISAGTEVTSG